VIALIGFSPDIFLVALARVSGFMLFLPGFSSLRIPVRVRAFLAAGLAIVFASFIAPDTKATAQMIASETAIGAALGMLVRFHFLALAFAGATIGSYLGLAPTPGLPIDADESQQSLQTLITLTATTLIFALGLHSLLLQGFAASYRIIPVGDVPDAQNWMQEALSVLDQAFLMALQISMPFLCYALLINVAIGLVNRMAPQVPVYFVSMPFVIAGGLLLFVALGADAVAVFMEYQADWLKHGWL
jgi:flagellar biosynthesis protein FliR